MGSPGFTYLKNIVSIKLQKACKQPDSTPHKRDSLTIYAKKRKKLKQSYTNIKLLFYKISGAL